MAPPDNRPLSRKSIDLLYRQLGDLPPAEAGNGHHPDTNAGETYEVDLLELGRNAHFFGGTTKVRVALERLEEAGVLKRGAYEGNRQQIQILPWDEEAVQAVAARLTAYRRQQLTQLEEMVAYAENTLTCRRATLLAHFDEEISEDPRPDCCDICTEKLEIAEFVAEIEEEAVVDP